MATSTVAVPTYESQWHWEQAGKELGSNAKHLQFAIGDWLNHGAAFILEEDRRYQCASELLDIPVPRLYQLASVASKVCTRVQNLSWSHHRLVAPLPPAEQSELLQQAVIQDWSVKHLARIVERGHPKPQAPTDSVAVRLNSLRDRVELYASAAGIEPKAALAEAFELLLAQPHVQEKIQERLLARYQLNQEKGRKRWRMEARRINSLIATYPFDSSEEFIQRYQNQFGVRFPFYFARACTDFKDICDSRLTAEDYGVGEFSQFEEEETLAAQILKSEAAMAAYDDMQPLYYAAT